MIWGGVSRGRSRRGALAVQCCLTEDQLARLETLATEAGMTCGGGACAQLRCGEEARRTHDDQG